MKIYFLEFRDSTKFYFEDNQMELPNDERIFKQFAKYIKKHFGRNIEFVNVMGE